MEKIDWFQIGKGVRQGCRVSPVYLNYMQSTSCEMSTWMNHKLESRFPGEMSTTTDMQLAESEEEIKSLLKRVKTESEKAGLKLNIQKIKMGGRS